MKEYFDGWVTLSRRLWFLYRIVYCLNYVHNQVRWRGRAELLIHVTAFQRMPCGRESVTSNEKLRNVVWQKKEREKSNEWIEINYFFPLFFLHLIYLIWNHRRHCEDGLLSIYSHIIGVFFSCCYIIYACNKSRCSCNMHWWKERKKMCCYCLLACMKIYILACGPIMIYAFISMKKNRTISNKYVWLK